VQSSDDRARLVEVKPPAGSPAFPLAEFNSNKRVNTVLTQAFLAVRQGRTIEMRWNLNRNGGQAGVAAAGIENSSDPPARLTAADTKFARVRSSTSISYRPVIA
jgi:hypothetical protein